MKLMVGIRCNCGILASHVACFETPRLAWMEVTCMTCLVRRPVVFGTIWNPIHNPKEVS